MTHTLHESQIAELYAAYCEFKNDAMRSLLSKTSDAQARENIRWVNRVLPKEVFATKVAELSAKPEEFAEFKDRLVRGWHNRT